MLNESIQAPIVNAPKRGSKMFDPCPIEGNGVHNWLFKTALRLHGRIAEDEIIELLKEKLGCVRPEREIREAVVNAGKYAKGEAGSASYRPWPSVDHALVYEIVVNSPIRLKDLSSISPARTLLRAKRFQKGRRSEMNAAEDIQEQLVAQAELLPPGIRRPINIVDGKPELILPNDHTYFTECAEQCFWELAKTEKFFRQGDLIVELIECSEGLKLVELAVEAFRSRLETYFTLRSYVSLRGGGIALKKKICSQDNAKALLATEAALNQLPAIQAVVNSPVFAEDEKGKLTVLNQGYYRCNGGIYVLRKREINTVIKVDEAVKALLAIVKDFSFLAESDKSRCIAGFISPALRFGRLLDADFPLDLCEADQSQTGKSFRMKVISRVYGERPFVITLSSEAKKGVGSLDESLSEALLSGAPFIALDNLRGEISNQLLESAIRGGRR